MAMYISVTDIILNYMQGCQDKVFPGSMSEAGGRWHAYGEMAPMQSPTLTILTIVVARKTSGCSLTPSPSYCCWSFLSLSSQSSCHPTPTSAASHCSRLCQAPSCFLTFQPHQVRLSLEISSPPCFTQNQTWKSTPRTCQSSTSCRSSPEICCSLTISPLLVAKEDHPVLRG